LLLLLLLLLPIHRHSSVSNSRILVLLGTLWRLAICSPQRMCCWCGCSGRHTAWTSLCCFIWQLLCLVRGSMRSSNSLWLRRRLLLLSSRHLLICPFLLLRLLLSSCHLGAILGISITLSGLRLLLHACVCAARCIRLVVDISASVVISCRGGIIHRLCLLLIAFIALRGTHVLISSITTLLLHAISLLLLLLLSAVCCSLFLIIPLLLLLLLLWPIFLLNTIKVEILRQLQLSLLLLERK
jgi:hypothetical protein